MSQSQSDPAKQDAGGDSAKEASAPTGGGELLGGRPASLAQSRLGERWVGFSGERPPHLGSGHSGTQTKEAVTGELC